MKVLWSSFGYRLIWQGISEFYRRTMLCHATIEEHQSVLQFLDEREAGGLIRFSVLWYRAQSSITMRSCKIVPIWQNRHHSRSGQHEQILQILLNKEAKNKCGTASCMAFAKGHQRITQMLLDNRCVLILKARDPTWNSRNKKGQRAMRSRSVRYIPSRHNGEYVCLQVEYSAS
jgi:hypothetical protein